MQIYSCFFFFCNRSHTRSPKQKNSANRLVITERTPKYHYPAVCVYQQMEASEGGCWATVLETYAWQWINTTGLYCSGSKAISKNGKNNAELSDTHIRFSSSLSQTSSFVYFAHIWNRSRKICGRMQTLNN